MSKVKKIIITIVSLVLVVCLAGGGIFTYKWYSAKKNPVEVIPVSNINNSWYGDYGSGLSDIYGSVSKGMSQSVYYDPALTINEILVKEGDEVEVGTPLIKYDTTLLNLQLQLKENDIKTIDMRIEALQKKLANLKKTKVTADSGISVGESNIALMGCNTGNVQVVSLALNKTDGSIISMSQITDVQEGSEEEIPVWTELTDSSYAYKGVGTEDNPFAFKVALGANISESFITKAVSDKCVCMIEVVSEDGENVLYSWTFDGKKVMDAAIGSIVPEEPSTEAPEPTEPSTEAPEPTEPDVPDEPIEPEDPDDPFDPDYPDYPDDPFDPGYSDDPFIPGYDDPFVPGMTKDELEKAIKETENEIASLNFDKRAAEIELKKLQNKLTDGTLLSTVNGTVGEILEENVAALENMPIMTVTAKDGTYISCYISENNLTAVSVGQSLTAMSYFTGNYYDATITGISDIPEEEYYGGDNESYYVFTAIVDGGEDLEDYSGVDITLNSDGQTSTSALYIEKAYVREENGIHYVYIKGEDGKLKKQPVRTGRVMDGYAMEIFEGLFESDYIAFPYGKNVKEGAPTVESDGSFMYY